MSRRSTCCATVTWLSLAFCLMMACETGLMRSGQLRADEPSVSFSDQVAPIFVAQCVACHNARTAKGRFNLETFNALMRGGESGVVVEAGDGDFSNLVLQVEAGEMPKDGDPLPEEQVALIRRWVAEGAKLDPGKLGDKPLAALIPKVAQPMPPEFYPAPVPVTALAFTPDGSRLAVGGYHEVLLFDAVENRLLRRISNIAERTHGIAFSPDGRQVAVAAGTPARLGEVKLFDVGTGEMVADLASAGDSFFAVTFSADGNRLAAAGADRSVRVWNTADRAELMRLEDHADWVMSVAFNHDGKRLVTASRDKTVKVFDLDTRQTVATFNEHTEGVLDAIFSPDEKQIVSAGKDKQVRVWKIDDLKQQRNIGFGGEVFDLATVGEQTFAVAAADRTARVIGFDGNERRKFEKLSDWTLCVAATPDGKALATGCYDGTVTLWNLETGEQIRSFPAMPPK